jgi:hypothetical protein
MISAVLLSAPTCPDRVGAMFSRNVKQKMAQPTRFKLINGCGAVDILLVHSDNGVPMVSANGKAPMLSWLMCFLLFLFLLWCQYMSVDFSNTGLL